jgi:hypothetical protein
MNDINYSMAVVSQQTWDQRMLLCVSHFHLHVNVVHAVCYCKCYIFIYFQGYFGCAVGKAKQAAKTEIEKLKLADMTSKELVKEAARM